MAGELKIARQHWEEAVALREQHGRGETPTGLETLANLGWLARAEGRDEDMAAIYARTIAISEPLLGRTTPPTSATSGCSPTASWRLGRPRQALARLARLEQRFDRLGNDYVRGDDPARARHDRDRRGRPGRRAHSPRPRAGGGARASEAPRRGAQRACAPVRRRGRRAATAR